MLSPRESAALRDGKIEGLRQARDFEQQFRIAREKNDFVQRYVANLKPIRPYFEDRRNAAYLLGFSEGFAEHCRIDTLREKLSEERKIYLKVLENLPQPPPLPRFPMQAPPLSRGWRSPGAPTGIWAPSATGVLPQRLANIQRCYAGGTRALLSEYFSKITGIEPIKPPEAKKPEQAKAVTPPAEKQPPAPPATKTADKTKPETTPKPQPAAAKGH